MRLQSALAAAAALGIVVLAAGCSRTSGARRAPTPPRGPALGMLSAGDTSLSYRYETPGEAEAPFPAVVIGHGSGETRKEECQSLAGQMLGRGYAVFCYDKRGVGGSTGTYSSVGPINSHELIPELASDMAAAVAFVRAQPGVDPERVGLLGGSQAGWVIPQAARVSSANFMILLVGPAVTVGQEVYYSRFAEETSTPLDQLQGLLAKYRGPTGFDPRADLEALDIPGLWLLAGADRSIPTPETVGVLDELIAGGKRYSRKIYPGASHSLQGINIWPDVDGWLRLTFAR